MAELWLRFCASLSMSSRGTEHRSSTTKTSAPNPGDSRSLEGKCTLETFSLHYFTPCGFRSSADKSMEQQSLEPSPKLHVLTSLERD